MPLMKSGSKKAVSANIRAERNAGKSQQQAIAIALNTARKYGKKYADGGGVYDDLVTDDDRPRPTVTKNPDYILGNPEERWATPSYKDERNRWTKFKDRTSEGWEEGFGKPDTDDVTGVALARNLGLSQETLSNYPSLSALQPAAVAGELGLRTIGGVLGAGVGAIGGAYSALGGNEAEANRLQRDAYSMLDYLGNPGGRTVGKTRYAISKAKKAAKPAAMNTGGELPLSRLETGSAWINPYDLPSARDETSKSVFPERHWSDLSYPSGPEDPHAALVDTSAQAAGHDAMRRIQRSVRPAGRMISSEDTGRTEGDWTKSIETPKALAHTAADLLLPHDPLEAAAMLMVGPLGKLARPIKAGILGAAGSASDHWNLLGESTKAEGGILDLVKMARKPGYGNFFKDKLNKAEYMEKVGRDPAHIEKALGVVRDAQGNWLFEIPDTGVKTIKTGTHTERNPGEDFSYQGHSYPTFTTSVKKGNLRPLSEIYENKKLTGYVPELNDIQVFPISPSDSSPLHSNLGRRLGSYLPQFNIVELAGQSPRNFLRTTHHEVAGHGVSQVFELPRGSTPDEFLRGTDFSSASAIYKRNHSEYKALLEKNNLDQQEVNLLFKKLDTGGNDAVSAAMGVHPEYSESLISRAQQASSKVTDKEWKLIKDLHNTGKLPEIESLFNLNKILNTAKKDANDKYSRTAGEILARALEERMWFNAQERKKFSLRNSLEREYPYSQHIIDPDQTQWRTPFNFHGNPGVDFDFMNKVGRESGGSVNKDLRTAGAAPLLSNASEDQPMERNTGGAINRALRTARRYALGGSEDVESPYNPYNMIPPEEPQPQQPPVQVAGLMEQLARHGRSLNAITEGIFGRKSIRESGMAPVEEGIRTIGEAPAGSRGVGSQRNVVQPEKPPLAELVPVGRQEIPPGVPVGGGRDFQVLAYPPLQEPDLFKFRFNPQSIHRPQVPLEKLREGIEVKKPVPLKDEWFPEKELESIRPGTRLRETEIGEPGVFDIKGGRDVGPTGDTKVGKPLVPEDAAALRRERDLEITESARSHKEIDEIWNGLDKAYGTPPSKRTPSQLQLIEQAKDWGIHKGLERQLGEAAKGRELARLRVAEAFGIQPIERKYPHLTSLDDAIRWYFKQYPDEAPKAVIRTKKEVAELKAARTFEHGEMKFPAGATSEPGSILPKIKDKKPIFERVKPESKPFVDPADKAVYPGPGNIGRFEAEMFAKKSFPVPDMETYNPSRLLGQIRKAKEVEKLRDIEFFNSLIKKYPQHAELIESNSVFEKAVKEHDQAFNRGKFENQTVNKKVLEGESFVPKGDPTKKVELISLWHGRKKTGDPTVDDMFTTNKQRAEGFAGNEGTLHLVQVPKDHPLAKGYTGKKHLNVKLTEGQLKSRKIWSDNTPSPEDIFGETTKQQREMLFGPDKKKYRDGGNVQSAIRLAGRYARGGPGSHPWNVRASSHPSHPSGMINSSIPGRTDKIPMSVPPGSYILPADVPSALGEGNTMAGEQILGKMFNTGPYSPKSYTSISKKLPQARISIPRIQTMPRMKNFANGGEVEESQEEIPIIAAGGEYVIHPEQVALIGNGDMKAGHRVLDRFVLETRKRHIETLKKLKPPKK